ncbi:GNAT family protein [Sulfuricurvum sp.]|uniref:GNAT family N-acetyltransferase n=1 Tax=Sulfuricurvum sp. TaxID=2025608 RepID=UPI0026248D4A|nr:GNAT family protein [Sulfuricurvum sp.]MDD2780478.1 GNAT family protein [Sulfuricurvum sp.]
MIHLKNYTDLTAQEHQDLLNIRNLTTIRNASTNIEEIDFTDHIRWIESLKTCSGKIYYAVFETNTLCGGIHLIQNNDETATWGIFFDPNTSVWVIASVTLYFIDRCFNHLGVTTLQSHIRTNNIPAIAFNRQLGFKPFCESDDFTLMQLDEMLWSAQKEKKILKNILQYATHYPINLESL